MSEFQGVGTKIGAVTVMAKPVDQKDDNESKNPVEIPFCAPCAPLEVAPVDKIIFPGDVYDLEEANEGIYIVGTRDGKVTKIGGLDHMKDSLTILQLRSCLVSKIENVQSLVNLTKLELYDNHLEEIDGLETLKNLRVLDLSFNAIRSMEQVSQCPSVEHLYIAQNKLRKIEGLETLVNLQTLDLGANRIRVIEGLETNTALTSLWLGKNKIERVTGLDNLHSIRQLDIQNNRLQTLEDGLKNLHKLEELYLACNALENLEGLPLKKDEHFPDGINKTLSTIDVSTNRIMSIEGVDKIVELEELWMTKSLLDSFDSLCPLASLPKLSCIYLEHSPIAKDFEYRKVIAQMIPTLEQLDATMVRRNA